jgi:hypothetical protein
MISTHLYLYKLHVLNDMGIHFSKERKKLYIFVKLLNQDETKDKTIWKWHNTNKIDQNNG